LILCSPISGDISEIIFFIQEKYLSNNIDDQFERVFCGFYIMNGARGLTKQQKKEFFKLLLSRETDLEKILRPLYKDLI